jgi:sulfite oxidase
MRQPSAPPTPLSRRHFLRASAALAFGGAIAPRVRAEGAENPALPQGKELLVRSAEPLNAEPALAALVEAEVTPVKHFYIRNHGPTPKLEVRDFKVRVEGLVGKPLELSLGELKERFRQQTAEVTLTCAGNRRKEMNAIKPVGGVQWDAGAIGHARWTGSVLADVLAAAELMEEAKHVWFEGLDPIQEKDGSVAPFGGSIPLDKALQREAPVLAAHAMNGEPLTAEHGFPVRTVVPGFIGARSVKWLAKIVVSDRPSPNHYVAAAYKLVQTEDRAEIVATQPIYAFPINAAICSPAAGARLKPGRIAVVGYALPAGEPGCTIEKVEVTRNGGQAWSAARLLDSSRPFTWRLWTAEIDLPAGKHELAVRATDSRGHTMPQRCDWNLKGYLYNAWHRVAVNVG